MIELFGEQWYENENLEQQAIDKALLFKKWVDEHDGRKPSAVLAGKTKEQKASATPDQEREHYWAQWFGDMKKAKKANSRNRLYPNVERILTELFGKEWYENEDLEQESIIKAIAFKAWVEEHGGHGIKIQCIIMLETSYLFFHRYMVLHESYPPFTMRK